MLGWTKLGHEKRLQARIVNYADDLVICCRGHAEEALARMRDIMTKLKLTVNETKTRVCRLPEEKFDFLGYTFGQCYSLKTGRAYLGTVPSRKRVKRICETLSELTGRDQILLDQEIVVARLNRREPAGSRSLSSIKCWASSALLRGRVVSRGRHRETFSESRMRSFRTSGSTSGV